MQSTDCATNQNLVCSSNKCLCSTNTYFNGLTCGWFLLENYLLSNNFRKTNFSFCLKVTQLSNLATCASSSQCGYGLYCVYESNSNQNYCECTADRYWDTTKSYCGKTFNLFKIMILFLLKSIYKVKKITYGVSGCTASNQCANGTNMTCASSTCTCPYPQYWNGTSCATLSTYGVACSINNGCDQTQGLQCSVTNQTLYICLCSTYYFWSTAQSKCLAQYMVTIGCNSSSECRTDLGLYCNTTGLNVCSCNSTYYWDTAQLLCGI